MKKSILLFLLLIFLLSSLVFSDDLILFKNQWQGESNLGYHEITEEGINQSTYHKENVKTQSELLVKMFTALYGVPEEDMNENTKILQWIAEDKEIFLKIDENYLIIQISDLIETP